MRARAFVFGLGVFLTATAASADTVVTHDGRRFSGEVSDGGDTITVQSKFGDFTLDKGDVAEWIKDKASTPTGAGAPKPPAVSPSGSAPTPAPTPAPSAPAPSAPAPPPLFGPPAAPSAAAAQKNVVELLKQADSAMAAADYATARDALLDASQLAPKNSDVLRGLGLAYLSLKDIPHARQALDQALDAIKPHRPDRVLAINAAAAQLAGAGANPLRAARVLMDYLGGPQNELDEPAQNALGVALRQTKSSRDRATPLFASAVRFYDQYNLKLEAACPGLRRWGAKWYPAPTVNGFYKEVDDRNKALASVAAEVETARQRAVAAQAQLDQAKQALALGQRSAASSVTAANQALTRALEELKTSRSRYEIEAARTLANPPSYPSVINALALNDTKPPPVTGEDMASAATASTAIAPAGTASNATAGAGEGEGDPLFPKPRPSGGDRPLPDEVAANPPAGGEKTPAPGDTPARDDALAAKGNSGAEEPTIEVAPPSTPASATPVTVTQYAAAFPVAPNLLVTAASPLAGATEATLETTDGVPRKCSVVRTDATTGLALLKFDAGGLTPLPLADSFGGGPAMCAAYAKVDLFNPAAVPLDVTTAAPGDGGWTGNFNHHNPRLAGSPLIAGGKVVGVELGSRGMDPAKIPLVTLDQLRTFLAAELPAGGGSSPADPCAVMFRVEATHRSQ